MLLRYLLLALTFLINLPICALAKPVELHPHIKSSEPLGQADLTWMFWDVYRVSLWADGSQWVPDKSYALSIVYKMAFSKEQLIQTTLDEMDRLNGSQSLPSGLKEKLEEVFVSVKENDRFTAYFSQNNEVKFYHNGRFTGEIQGRDFAQTFSAIWLSEQTVAPDVRSKLLAMK